MLEDFNPEDLKGLDNDLGEVESPEPLEEDVEEILKGGVPCFDNTDVDASAEFEKEEVYTLVRMLPIEKASVHTAGDEVDLSTSEIIELGMDKLNTLSEILIKEYSIARYLESLGGDTDHDLLLSMLSIAGEIGRIRRVVLKALVGRARGADEEEL